MARKSKKLIRGFFIVSNFVVVFFYLLVCLVPFLNAGKFWFVAMLGLAFPLLLIFVLVFLIILLIMRSRWVFLSLAALLISWQQLSVVFAIRTGKEFNVEKPQDELRVLSWNVSRWDEFNKKLKGGVSFRGLMMDVVKEQEADVLCFQEFFESHSPTYFDSNIPVLEKMGFPYHYFFITTTEGDGNFQNGMIIFSRYPVIDSGQYLLAAKKHSEGLCYVDIKVQNQVFRVFAAHLQSVGFERQDYEGVGKIAGLRSILSKIKNSYQLRSEQAEMARKFIDASPYPVIVCGDLDDVPSSYVYFKVKGKLQDAFLRKGAGFGRTFQFISPTLRIDYILADEKFKIDQFARLKIPYSSHYPIIADMHFKEMPQ
jgi:endonuclease/exonuclease/phosphatase family metal-dependent hydrolase